MQELKPITVDIREASRLTGIPEWTLRDWRKKGEHFRTAKIGRRVLWVYADLVSYIDAHTETPTVREAAEASCVGY